MRHHSLTLVVAPHPDDEVLGAGIWMYRQPRECVHIVHLTDGSPRDLKDAERLGFATRQAYAAVRRREFFGALEVLEIPPSRCTAFGVADQEAFLNLTTIIDRLASLVSQLCPDRILSPAYEGGHPDHDAAAFAVAVLRNRRPDFDHLEFPLYHSDKDGQMVTGQFLAAPFPIPEEVLKLSPAERNLKSAMLACFRTQQEILSRFSLECERFRIAPAYDFTLPPHAGPLLYERWGWSIHGAAWREQARRALLLKVPARDLLLSTPGTTD
jgi:LmbE family N-acetylglucosaminyl deacetylase